MITGLALITSLGCSLECDYCPLVKDEKQLKHLSLQQENIKALQNGTFIKNVKETLESLNIFPESIDNIVFWGMEPTLTLKYMTEHIKDWFNLFPNWHSCFFSTNGQQNYQDIYDFVEAASSCSSGQFSVEIQCSYDGHEFTNINRHTKKTNWLQSFQKFLNDQISKKENHNFFFKIYPHGVITAKIIDYLNNLSIDELAEYFETQEYYSFIEKHTQYTEISEQVGYSLENPYRYTQQDGINITQLITKMTKSNYAILKKYGMNILAGCANLTVRNPLNLVMPINELITFCGTYTDRLFIKYDGTIVHCATIPFKDKFKNHPWTKHNFFYNSKNNIQKSFYDNYWETLNLESNIFQYENIKNNIKILAQFGEIHPIYLELDEQTLDQHIRYMLFHNSCFEGYYTLTNSTLTTPLSHIKLFGNGLCFLLDEYKNTIFFNNGE